MNRKPILILGAALAAASLAQAQEPQKPAAPPAFEARCAGKLIPYSDWDKVKDPVFRMEAAAPQGRLHFYGAEHSSDPEHPQFGEIEAAWNALKPTVAFYEGPARPIPASKIENIRMSGESGMVRFLAVRDAIPALSLEPSPQEEAAYVMTTYTPEQVMLFYVLREASRLRERRGLSEEEVKKATAQLLERASKMLPGFESFSTLDALQAAYRKHWSEPANWWQAPSAWFDPLKSSAQTGGIFTNEINKMSSEFRNLHMFRTLAKAVLEGNRVFAVVGRNHVAMQDAALRCALAPQ